MCTGAASYLVVVSPRTISIQHLFRPFSAWSAPTWMVLNPTLPAHATAYQPGGESLRPVNPVGLAQVILTAPHGGRVSSTRASWVEKVVGCVFGRVGRGEYAVFLHVQCGQPVALLGWSLGSALKHSDVGRQLPGVREFVRSLHDRAALEAEAGALRYLLTRGDCCVAATRADGKMIGATWSARDLMGELAHGSRHYYRRQPAPLPSGLVSDLAQLKDGQRKLGPAHTARFRSLPVTGSEWCPVLEIEFFSEKQTPSIEITRLSPVEREVVALLTMGKTNPEIARLRGVSRFTVKNQVAGILAKTGCHRRTELVALSVYHVQERERSSALVTTSAR